jgi:hypothetical protein
LCLIASTGVALRVFPFTVLAFPGFFGIVPFQVGFGSRGPTLVRTGRRR